MGGICFGLLSWLGGDVLWWPFRNCQGWPSGSTLGLCVETCNEVQVDPFGILRWALGWPGRVCGGHRGVSPPWAVGYTLDGFLVYLEGVGGSAASLGVTRMYKNKNVK